MSYRVPAFSYPGGKARLREWLVARMPLYGKKYIEPFVGRGNVFWLAVHMLDYESWHLNDPWTARWFEAIRRVNLEEIPPYLTAFLVRLYVKRAVDNRETDDVAVAVEDSTMFSGGIPWGITHRWRQSPSLAGLKQRIVQARSILRATEPRITALDWKEMALEKLEAQDFVYMDPPYQDMKTGYGVETVIHTELVKYLQEAPHLWMLSGYRSPLYIRMLGEPYAQKPHKPYIKSQSKRQIPISRTDCIWTNYTMEHDGIARRRCLKSRKIRKIRKK